MEVYGLVARTVVDGEVVDVNHEENGQQVYYETMEQAEAELSFWQLRSFAVARYGEVEIYRIEAIDVATL